MKKGLFGLVVLVMFALSGCNSNELNSITLEGLSDKTVSVGATFNALEGVKVVGDNGIEYSDSIIVSSFACGFDENNNLYTSKAKKCDITYTAVVEGKYVSESITVIIE